MIPTEEHRSKTLVPSLQGRTTAREAFSPALANALRWDAAARLFLVVSGEDIDHNGSAATWEFFFRLPTRRAKAVYQVSLDWDSSPEETAPVYMAEHVDLFLKPNAFLAQLLRSGQISQDAVREAWLQELAKPSLPVPFRDSPEVVQALSSQGADFISGDTSMCLTGEARTPGEAVWKVTMYDDEYLTPFT